MGPKSLVKIGSVIDEMFLIGTNFAQTNVKLTNVTIPWQLTSVKDVFSNLHLKFGRNGVSNSWDTPDIDKYCHNKCCIDKCPRYCWNLVKMVPGTFGQNGASISWVIVEIEFLWVVVVVDQSHFHVKPNLGYVRLNWGWVGVLTKVGFIAYFPTKWQFLA